MRILYLCICVFFLFIVLIGVGGYIIHNKLPPKEELEEITGYIFEDNNDWYFVFEEVADNNTMVSDEKLLFSLKNKEGALTNFTSGDKVKMWIEGITDSIPGRISAVYIEKVNE